MEVQCTECPVSIEKVQLYNVSYKKKFKDDKHAKNIPNYSDEEWRSRQIVSILNF